MCGAAAPTIRVEPETVPSLPCSRVLTSPWWKDTVEGCWKHVCVGVCVSLVSLTNGGGKLNCKPKAIVCNVICVVLVVFVVAGWYYIVPSFYGC